MSQYSQNPLDRLKEIDPNTPTSEKVRFLRACFTEWLSWALSDNNVSDEYKALAKAIQRTSEESPNINMYIVIVLGMNEGGWWRLTETQRQVMRNYIFERNTFTTVAGNRGVTYPSTREAFLRGLENLRIHAVHKFPSLEGILTPELIAGKSKSTHQYVEEKKENLAKMRETDAYANRQFKPGWGRGHRKEHN